MSEEGTLASLEDTSAVRRRMDELLGFVQGSRRDASPEGLAELATLREQWESMGARNLAAATRHYGK